MTFEFELTYTDDDHHNFLIDLANDIDDKSGVLRFTPDGAGLEKLPTPEVGSIVTLGLFGMINKDFKVVKVYNNGDWDVVPV